MAYHTINTSSSNKKPSSNPSNSNNNQANAMPNITTANQNSVNTNSEVPETLIDYEKLASQQKIHPVQFRDAITKRLLTTLTTTNHPNALLVGEAGTGKTAIVEDLAVKLFQKDPLATAMLGDKTKIYELPLNNLVAGSSMMGATEAKTKEVLNFISDPNNHAILYIDEIHQLMTNENLKKVAEILKPALSRANFRTIGATTTQELKFWRNNPAMNRRFSNIIVNELSDDQTEQILNKTLPKLQFGKTKVQIDPTLFKHIVNVGNQYAKSLSTHRPDSAITILDQGLAIARLRTLELNQSMHLNTIPKLTKSIIDKAGKQLLNDDTKSLSNQTVTDLKATLDQNIIGQPKAKQALIKAVQSMVLNLIPQTKPHSFLFAGASGTGKTEIAKQLAKVLFNSSKRYIYLNMTEYANRGSITSLIGSSRGYIGSNSAQPLPLDALKSNPMQVIVLDEFEKADSQVAKLFMQALDEGTLTYADGSTVDFSHSLVIATTNAGSQSLNQPTIGFNNSNEISQNELTQSLMSSFPPELINRFEYVIGFNPITKDEYQQIVVLKYNHLINQISKHHPELTLEPQTANVDMNFIQKLTQDSYNPMKNARPAQRSVKKFVENQILAQPGQVQFNFDK